MIKVSFLGQLHSFSNASAKEYFRNCSNISFVPTESTQHIFTSVLSRDTSYGVIPIETTSVGTIRGVYDKLLSHNEIKIVAEISMVEKHCLCVRPDLAETLEIERIMCHPHILECCSDFMDELDVRRGALGKAPVDRIPHKDSSAACQIVSASETKSAAIGTPEAAAFYNLKILSNEVGNETTCQTRYIIIARSSSPSPTAKALEEGEGEGERKGEGKDPEYQNKDDPLSIVTTGCPTESNILSRKRKKTMKCSIALGLKNVPGALHKMTSCFAFRNIDVIKIESHPASAVKGKPSELYQHQKHWDLIFYIDYEPNNSNETNEALIANLKEYTLWIKELGVYVSEINKIDTGAPVEWKSVIDVIL